MKSDNYVVIQGWMCNELELKGNELLVYALIYGFSQDKTSNFHGGRKYIADTFNISLPTVDKALQELIAKDLIIKFPCENHANTDSYITNISSKETLLLGSKETLHNNITNNIYNKENTKVFSQPPAVVQETLLEDTSNISKKPKKKNLWESCYFEICEFTEDIEVRDLLRDYLNMRLEISDKKFGSKTFKGMLKKLRSLTDSKAECIKIIQQAIDRQYLTFYPVKEYTGYKRTTGKDVELMSTDKVEQVSQEDKERIIKYGKKF